MLHEMLIGFIIKSDLIFDSLWGFCEKKLGHFVINLRSRFFAQQTTKKASWEPL